MRDADSIKDNIPFNAELEDRTTEEWCAQVAGLQNEITRLRAALEAVEWIDERPYAYCPWCDGLKLNGHAPDCQRQKAFGIIAE